MEWGTQITQQLLHVEKYVKVGRSCVADVVGKSLRF